MKTRRQQTDEIAPRDLRRFYRTGKIPQRYLSCRLPPLFAGTTLDELRLPARARKLFERRKYIERPEALARLTLGDLVQVPGLAFRSIVDIVEALHQCAELRGLAPPDPALSTTPELAPRDLREHLHKSETIPTRFHGCRLPPIPPGVTLADLRLTGRALRFVRDGAYVEKPDSLAQLTIGDLLQRRGLGVLSIVVLMEAIYRCVDAGSEIATLDEEILAWLVPKGQPLRRRIVIERYGFGGRRGRSLEAIGRSTGYTRERIRQLCMPRIAPPRSVLRRFQAAVDAVREQLSRRAVEVEASLASQGLLSAGTKLESLLRVAKLLGCEAGFIVAGTGPHRRALPAPTEATLRLQKLLKKLVRVSPVLRLLDLQTRWEEAGEAPLEPTSIEDAIQAASYLHWLDREHGWLWIDRPGTPVRRRIGKALAASNRLTIAELAEAVWRSPRAREWPRVPLDMFQEFCRQLPECRVIGDSVRAASPAHFREALRGDEKKLVEYLRRRGEACHLSELKEFALNAGMCRQSLWKLLIGSPAVKRYGPRVYGLLRL